MNDFLEQWLKALEESPKDAWLEALTILCLKNVTEEYEQKFFVLLRYFEKNDNNPNLCKIKQIYLIFKEHEVTHLRNLNTINQVLNNVLSSKQNTTPSCKPLEKKEFKKWWI